MHRADPMLVVAAAWTLCNPASSKIIGMKLSPPMIDSGTADNTWLQNHQTTIPMSAAPTPPPRCTTTSAPIMVETKYCVRLYCTFSADLCVRISVGSSPATTDTTDHQPGASRNAAATTPSVKEKVTRCRATVTLISAVSQMATAIASSGNPTRPGSPHGRVPRQAQQRRQRARR